MAVRLTARARKQTRSLEIEDKRGGLLMALPAILWLTFFFLVPLLIVFVISFLTRGSGGNVELPFTTAAYDRALTVFSPIILRSLRIAAIVTVICLVVGYPMAFFIKTRRSPAMRQLAFFLVILPFWTNFIVRMYAWRVLLGPEGTINSLLINMGLASEPLQLLYNEFAVFIGLTYGFLPFMVLPIYATMEKFDFRFIEAAHDLGANNWSAFWRVMLPLTLPGIIAGSILVFIPSIGAYVVPDMLGGTSGLMIGNLIQNQFRGSGGNLPLGAALSMILMAVVLVSLIVYVLFADRD